MQKNSENLSEIDKALSVIMLSETELGHRWGISVKTLQAWRQQPNKGPRFCKIGRLVRYRLSDIVTYEEQQSSSSTYDYQSNE